MAATRFISIDLVGRNTSAIKAISEVGTASEKAARTSAVAFDASTSKIGRSFSAVGQTAALLGVPFASSLGQIGSHFEEASSKGKGFGSTVSRIGAVEAVAAGAGIAVLATQVGSFISEGRESLKVGRQTEAVLKSTGNAANVTADQVGSLADSLSKKAGIDDEVIQSGENVLLTFTNIRNEVGKGNDIFTQATTSALDMSAALGTDLQSSVIQVGKALQDPIRGITALRRVGVNFTEAQRDQIKVLVESGHTMEAQKLILKELSTEFGGAAKAAADPFDKLGVSVKNVEEKIGLFLIPQLGRAGAAGAAMAHGFQSANDATGGLLGKTVAFGAAVPVAVFAVEKLVKGGAAVVGQYGKVANVLHLTSTANEATAASENELTVAQSQSAVAASRKELAIAKLPALEAAEAAATTQLVAANEAQVLALSEASAATQVNVAAQSELVAAREAANAAGLTGAAATAATTSAETAAAVAAERLAVAETEVAATSRAAAVAQGQYGAASRAAAASSTAASEAASTAGAGAGAGFAKALGPMTLFVAGGVALGSVLRGLPSQFALSDEKLKELNGDLLKGGAAASKAREEYAKILGTDVAADLQRYSDLLVANASDEKLAAEVSRQHKDVLRDTAEAFFGQAKAAELSNSQLQGMINRGEPFALAFSKAKHATDEAASSLRDLVKEYGASAVQTATLSAAQKRYADLLASGTASDRDLASARREVTDASRENAATQNQVNTATQAGTDASNKNTDATKAQAKAQDELLSSLKAVNEDLLASANADLALARANNDVGVSALAAAAATREHGKASQESVTAQFSLRGALLSAVAAAEAEAEATDKAKIAHGANISAIQIENDKHAAAVAELAILKAQYPQLSALIDQYRVSLGLIPKSVDTQVSVTVRGGVVNVGGGVRRFADGGAVPGKDPTGIPILAHPGEFVVSARGVQKYGLRAMEQINKGKAALPKFASGGVVGPAPHTRSFALGGAGGDTYQFHFHGNVEGFDDFENRVIKALRKETTRNGSVKRVRVSG